MATTVYKKTALTGGGATALDGIDGSGLLDLDMAFVTVAGVLYVYILDADDAGVESSPTRITPDANAGNKRWLLQDAYLMNVTASAAELNLNDGAVAGTAVASKTLALGANKNVDTIVIADGGLKLGSGAGTAVTSTAAELNKLDGVTATTAELNKLAGATATTAQLNYVTGVTSAIQTQLDGKATKNAAGTIAQITKTVITTAITGTTAIPKDNTIPQNSEGIEVMTLSITPSNASNILHVRAVLNCNAGNRWTIGALFKDSEADCRAATVRYSHADEMDYLILEYRMVAGTTSAITFKVRAGAEDTTLFTVNRTFNNLFTLGGYMTSGMEIAEVNV